MTISLLVLFISILLVLAPLIGYPVYLLVISRFRSVPHQIKEDFYLPVSIIVPFRGKIEILKAKIENFYELDYPEALCELIVSLDGQVTDENQLSLKRNDRLLIISEPDHLGKAYAINRAIPFCKGDLILLTDADAMLRTDAVKRLVRHFYDPNIGGVVGLRKIKESKDHITRAQFFYINFDSLIKRLESTTGNATSNDGKIYMIRRDLFEPIDPMSTDDLYMALKIVRKRRRFIFDQDAIAYIRKPSRSISHEIYRRRRIVSRSLRAIMLNGEVLNPMKFGGYSLELFVNKILRRLMFIPLLCIFIFSFNLREFSLITKLVFWGQCVVYLSGLWYPVSQLLKISNKRLAFVANLSAAVIYFLAGNFGSFLGVCDFFRGKFQSKWEPKKD